MSLLNDMLRNLSHHNPVVDGGEGYDQTLLHSASFSQRKRLPWAGLATVFVLVFAGVLAVNYALHNFVFGKNVKISSHSSATTSDPAPVEKIEVESVIAEFPASKSSQQNPLAQADTEENLAIQREATNHHINDLLQQAERALGMDRLTTPVEDNAYGYYQKVLSMDASNDDAKVGLDEIAKRYLKKAEEQFALGNSQAAEALVQRARFVSARFVHAHEIPVNDNNQFDSELAVNLNTKHGQEHSQAPAAAETIKPFNAVETSNVKDAANVKDVRNLSVSPNAAWKDQQLVRHAQDLIQQHKQSEALLALKNFIATEKQPILSTALLADIYIQNGNIEAAGVIANQAHYLPEDIKTKINAQITSINGDNARAIALLEKSLHQAENNEPYRSLLASLYHKTANYDQSIISYQRLINSFGEKPAYWLGLALAYDGLSQYQNALQAYKRLREFPELQKQVTQYTDQRIAALGSER